MEEIKKIPTPTMVKLSTKYKMVITPLVEQKIRYLCNKIWSKEWSGILFYKAEGAFNDGSLIITCIDIFVMDIGNTAYTEFDMSPDVIAYMVEHPELIDCQTGLVHSHNTMPAFFSSTDISTLKEEGMERNHFVSLIVNNEGSYTAAITRNVKSKRVINETISYKSFEDALVEAVNDYKEEVEELQYFDLDIIKPENCSFSDIDTRLTEIKKAKEAKETKIANYKVCDPNVLPPKVYNDSPISVVKQSEFPFDAREIESEPPFYSNKITADPKLIHSLCLQLLTGSIILPNESKININKWVNNMKSIVEKRFGAGTKGLKTYEEFVVSMVEFLVLNTDDPTLANVVYPDDMMGIIAENMSDYIGTLPKNIYTGICQKILSDYI